MSLPYWLPAFQQNAEKVTDLGDLAKIENLRILFNFILPRRERNQGEIIVERAAAAQEEEVDERLLG